METTSMFSIDLVKRSTLKKVSTSSLIQIFLTIVTVRKKFAKATTHKAKTNAQKVWIYYQITKCLLGNFVHFQYLSVDILSFKFSYSPV